MTDSYYNTTGMSGRELQEAEGKASTQEDRIIAFYETASSFLYTPSEICKHVFDSSVPLTSVRRAMTNLTDQGRLVKSIKKREGIYGRMEHCWFRQSGKPAQGELHL
jgi:hypothetical protein